MIRPEMAGWDGGSRPSATSCVEEESFLSNHTVSMRNALQYCLSELRSHSVPQQTTIRDSSHEVSGSSSAQDAARNLAKFRLQSLKQFYGQLASASSDTEDSSATSMSIEILPSLSPPYMSPREFRRRFQQANLPCKIQHVPPRYFETARAKMVRDNSINRKWFLECLGKGTTVPVRLHPDASQSPSADPTLDEAGRAVECETREMSMQEWIHLLEQAQARTDSSSWTRYYLKDWHLQSYLATHAPQHTPLYQVPPHFGVDLLNRFLTSFCNGDYQFCYWGPAGSKTSRHSDVLHSFSWSYNVCGTKLWTFYPPPLSSSTCCNKNFTADDAKDPAAEGRAPVVVQIRQEAGECIFVPAGWQHQVENVQHETLSINHNWITTANLDVVLECLRQEMISIEAELVLWDHKCDTDDTMYWDMRESMLRGCVGLDVTAFFLMTMVGLIDVVRSVNGRVPGQVDHIDGGSNEFWEQLFDLTILSDMIHKLANDEEIRLLDRLKAALADAKLAQEAYELATATVVQLIDATICKIDV